MTIEQVEAGAAAAVEHRDVEIFGVGGAPSDGPMLPDDIRVGLIESGARRTLARILAAAAAADVGAWARVAIAADIPIAEIARLTGATRAAVYRWLGDAT